MDLDVPRPVPRVLLFDVDIRLFHGFVRTMRRSAMAMVVSSFAGGGRPVVGGRQ
jgi:hypothetical protein